MLGWCIGAILTTIYAAMRPDDGLRNLLLLTAPLDFSDRNGITFARWTDEKYFNVDKVLDAFGNMPGEMIDYGAKALKPVENYITNYCKLWDNLDDPQVVEAWHAMNTWVTDNIPMAGGAYRQLIVDLYRNNRLMKNELVVRGERVDLGRIRANLLTVIAAGRSHHAPLSVGSNPRENRQQGQGTVPDSRWSHRDHGRKRGAQDHLATYRPVAERPLPVNRTPNATYRCPR